MAKMWPRELPDEIRSDKFRLAECMVFDNLEKTLDDDYVVFYSRPWLGETRSGEERDGECDFVVAHPKFGFLAIEVKGGGISWDPETDKWTTVNRRGIESTIKNPVMQAVSSKHQILEKLKKASKYDLPWIGISHGIIFPNSKRPESEEDLGPDKPLKIFCFKEEFSNGFGDWIERRMREGFENGEYNQPLGWDGIRNMEDLLAKPIQLKYPLSEILAEDERKIRYFTTEEFHMIRYIEDLPRVSIMGGAGTGKTVIAMEEARRCAEAGMKVLFLCFNRPLSLHVNSLIGQEPNIDVYTFHAIYRMVVRESGRHSFTKPDEDMTSQLVNKCLEILQHRPNLMYDAVIIDEGQDFQPAWWKVINRILTPDETARIRVFIDNNQNVYDQSLMIPADISPAPIKMSRNLRNTRFIHEEVMKHYSGSRIDSPFHDGVEVSWIPAPSAEMIRDALETRVRDLMIQENIERKDVAVLAANEAVLNQITPEGRIGSYYTRKCDEENQTRIIADTVRRFKGLESTVVVLILTPDLVRSHELVYVGLSRARTLLTVIGEEKSIRRVRDVKKQD